MATVAGISDHSVGWGVTEVDGGVVDSTGRYTAPAALGTYHVVATSLARPTARGGAVVLVTNTPAVSVGISPHSTAIFTGAHQAFTATVSGSVDTAVTWSVTEPSGGTIDSSGAYTAPATAGTYHVVATSHADSSKKDTAAVTVTAAPPVTVTVSPKTSVVTTGLTAQFSASVTGGGDSTVTWSVQEGSAGGTITSGGLYSAPATPGTYHVVAKSNADQSKSDNATVTVNAPGPVSVNPHDPTLMVGGVQQFTGSVNLPGDTTFTWSVQEGASGGAITSGGLYTAPATPGTYHVVATAHADNTKTDTAAVKVVALGAVDTWTQVTPAGMSMSTAIPDNYGAQDVLADPARPGDFYAFTCSQGVWKSTDYGQTWTRISNSSLAPGKHWSAAIDKNPNRNPGTPPMLWTLSWPTLGVWRSTDGGSNWTRFALPASTGQDGYSYDVDPYDSNHLLIGFHESAGFAESNDAGVTWSAVTLAAGMSSGASWYPFFVDTGTAATTRATWLVLPQPTGGMIGTWRTTNSGGSWTKVETNEHPHGNSQIYQAPGAIFMGGQYGSGGGNGGVYRSVDLGATWTHLGNQRESAIVYGTTKKIYAQYAWANSGTVDQSFTQRSAQPGSAWADWPLAMTNGPKHAAVASDGTHNVVVGGNWLAGIWRYVEP